VKVASRESSVRLVRKCVRNAPSTLLIAFGVSPTLGILGLIVGWGTLLIYETSFDNPSSVPLPFLALLTLGAVPAELSGSCESTNAEAHYDH
jgi:hypothetical protein